NRDQQTEKEPLIGTWEYTWTEFNDGTPLDLDDERYRGLHQQQLGLTFTFTKDSQFHVTQKDTSGRINELANQPYELSEDRKTVTLKNTGRPDDKFPIIHLSDSLLKINIFYSTDAYMVFRKTK